MISKLHHEVMKFIVFTMGKYGIKMDVKYVPSLDMLNQYLTSLNYKKLFTLEELTNLTEEELKKLQKESYNLLMYKYSPLRRVEDKFNNIDLEIYFEDYDKVKSRFKEKQILEESGFYEVIQFVRQKKLEDPDFKIPFRDALYGAVSYECKFLTYSTDIMNNFQFLYLKKFGKQRTLTMELIVDEDIEPIELDFNITFSNIEDIGHIDYTKYGNLLQVSFNCNVYGMFLSNFVDYVKPLKEIQLKLKL